MDRVDKETVHRVLDYLRRRGFRAADTLRAEWESASSVAEFVERSNAEPEMSQGSLQVYAPEQKASRYDESYTLLQNWVDWSLDLYKMELLPILYPVFVHCYLDLVEKEHIKEAAEFLAKHRSAHDARHKEEIDKLAGIRLREHLSNEIAQAFRGKKYVVHMSRYSFELLTSFLQELKYFVIERIINDRLRIETYRERPQFDRDPTDTDAAVYGAAELAAYVQAGRWGLPRIFNEEFLFEKEKEAEEERAAAAASTAAAGATPGTAATDGDRTEVGTPATGATPAPPGDGGRERDETDGARKRKRKDAEEAKRRAQEEFITHVPLPDTTEEFEAEVLEDLRRRVPLHARSLPSACCFTLLNTHQGLHCLDVSGDASMVAAGFSNSSVRLWTLDPQRGFRDDLLSTELLFASQPAPAAPAPGDPMWTDVAPPATGAAALDASRKAQTMTLVGHAGPVYGVSISPDRRFVLSASQDCTVRLWSVATGSNVVVYKGHTGAVWDVKFSPLGYYFVTASRDRTARVWSTDHVYALRYLAGHLADVDCVQFHPNCNYVATGSSDRTIRVWDVQSGECVRLFVGHTAPVTGLSFSPDGRTLASCSVDKTVRLWDNASGKFIASYQAHTAPVWSVDFSADSNVLASGGADCTVRIWDARPNDPRAAAAAAATAPAAASLPGPAVSLAPAGSEPTAPVPGLLATYYTKMTPVLLTRFTRRNMLLVGGAFTPTSSSS